MKKKLILLVIVVMCLTACSDTEQSTQSKSHDRDYEYTENNDESSDDNIYEITEYTDESSETIYNQQEYYDTHSVEESILKAIGETSTDQIVFDPKIPMVSQGDNTRDYEYRATYKLLINNNVSNGDIINLHYKTLNGDNIDFNNIIVNYETLIDSSNNEAQGFLYRLYRSRKVQNEMSKYYNNIELGPTYFDYSVEVIGHIDNINDYIDTKIYYADSDYMNETLDNINKIPTEQDYKALVFKRCREILKESPIWYRVWMDGFRYGSLPDKIEDIFKYDYLTSHNIKNGDVIKITFTDKEDKQIVVENIIVRCTQELKETIDYYNDTKTTELVYTGNVHIASTKYSFEKLRFIYDTYFYLTDYQAWQEIMQSDIDTLIKIDIEVTDHIDELDNPECNLSILY